MQADLFKLRVWEPQGFEIDTLTPEQRKVYSMLIYHAVGLGNAVKQRDLALRCWPDARSDQTRRLQIVLKELTELHGLAIGTSCRAPFGVYLIECQEELGLYTRNLFNRAMSGLKRYSSLTKVHGAELAGQIRLGLEG